jgi:hypothetical protein
MEERTKPTIFITSKTLKKPLKNGQGNAAGENDCKYKTL